MGFVYRSTTPTAPRWVELILAGAILLATLGMLIATTDPSQAQTIENWTIRAS